jgi:hypothetical protein
VSGKLVEGHLEAKGKTYGEFMKIYSWAFSQAKAKAQQKGC